jgi:hypothetical protein
VPHKDIEKRRAYYREYRRVRRAGDTRSTPVHPAIPIEFRLDTAASVIALLEDQVLAVLEETEVSTVERARCVGYLAGVSLKAIESGNLAARIEQLELILKRREDESKR